MQHTHWLLGIDEAGRGPLAGPVSVGVFAIEEKSDQAFLAGIRDSKTLSEKQREAWYTTLTTQEGARHAVAFSSAHEIDSKGIVWSIKNAMRKALAKLDLDPQQCHVFLDGGLRAPIQFALQETIIRGDATISVISAAAILAKVTRDRYLVECAQEYPAYGFEKHKGYGTAYHRERLVNVGPCPLHRLSFCKNILHS